MSAGQNDAMQRTLCLVTHGYPEFEGDLRGNFLRELAQRLASRGVHVVVSVPWMGPVQDQEPFCDPGVELRRFQWRKSGPMLDSFSLRNPGDLVALANLLLRWRSQLKALEREYHFDGLLAAWAVPAGVVAATTFAHQKPLALWLLGSDINRFVKSPLRPLVRMVLRRSSPVLAASRELALAVAEIDIREAPCQVFPAIRILGNRAGGSQCDPPDTRCYRFLFIGRLEPVKGPDILLRAFAMVCQNNPDARLRLIGGGSMQQSLRELADKLGIAEQVELLGYLPDSELASNLEWCDILVIPSRSEGMPMVFFEAMQYSRPVIGADVGDLRYYLEEFNVGEVVAPRDELALAEAMERSIHEGVPFSREGAAQALDLVDPERQVDWLLGEMEQQWWSKTAGSW